MQNSGRKLLALAVALVMVGAGAAVAGENAGAVFSLGTPVEVTGIDLGETVQVALVGTGMANVKQVQITLRVDPVDAFDLTTVAFAANAAFSLPLPTLSPGPGLVRGGAASIGAALAGDATLATFTLTAAAGIAGTTATIFVNEVSLGPSSTSRDVFAEAALNLAVTVNPPAPPPTVAAVVPNSGFTSGGILITITGANFQDGATVTIGGSAATGVSFVAADTLTATVPAHAAGAVDVVVTNPDGLTGTLAGGFTFLVIPPPAVASVTPNFGPTAGGTGITITGADFQSGATVSIGGAAATGVTFVSATSLTATTAAHAEGAVNVVVSNPDGQIGTLAGGFTYIGIVEPRLSAVGATDRSLDYSAVGTGDVADGSAGEVTFAVTFRDSSGAAKAGQTVSFGITNSGAEAVYLLGASVTEIAAGADLSVEVVTGASGVASIVLDAAGGKDAGPTTATVAVTTTAVNSDGVSRAPSAGFSATWDVPVVAELASFLGSVMPGDGVVLEWSVASQTNNLGWEVFRSMDNVTFEQVGELVLGEGTSDELRSYTFSDGQLPVAEVLYYYLNQVDLDGTASRSGVIEVALSGSGTQQALPVANALWQNYPNPFNPETTIGFDLTQPSVVRLTIHDVAGQVVRTVVDGQALSAGHYNSVWDGRDESGMRVSSGAYFCVLRAGDFTSMRKMVLVQ